MLNMKIPSPERKTMRALQTQLANQLVSLPRNYKQLIVIANDVLILLLALWAAFSLRLGFFFLPSGGDQWLLFLVAPVITIAGLKFSGAYRRINRYVGRTGARRTLTGLTLGVFLWSVIAFLSGIDIIARHGVPRSIPLIYLALSFLFIWSSREFASWYLTGSLAGNTENPGNNTPAKKILIWGYGDMALQLAHNLQLVAGYEPIGIIDEDKSLHFLKADDIKIFPPDYLDVLIPKEHISEIFIDNEIVSKKKQLEIVSRLDAHPVILKVLPSVEDIVSGNISIEEVKQIKVEDLLGRDPVPADQALIRGSVENKSILVTGAGGSIGSELVRQLIQLGPEKLILFELSEAALYHIHSEIEQIAEAMKKKSTPPVIKAVIGSVVNEQLVAHVIKQHKVQTIYHAAAYKHVPLVEHNPVVGLQNNTFGTWAIARAARKNGVERMILISTDKAVRPTNVMGASKRLAEMVLQAMSAQSDCQTVFSMVRFGNVLDSSGSVVPKFRQQIHDGGPVTVTHPDIVRYFMLTSEAVELVIQAGTLAQKGAVFVLDMGEPVKIVELARTMINLAGKSVRDEKNPDGDIAIEFTGLRPGEKLYEELLIGKNTSPTSHPRIRHLDEPFVSLNELSGSLAQLENNMKEQDIDAIKHMLTDLVEGYRRKELADHIDAQ
jgi:FlaA1/EpsC-like NDP-sugar epimerase